MMSRIKKIRKIMDERGLDAILVTDMHNIRYLSNFTGSNAQIILTMNDNLFFTDGRYATQSKEEVEHFKIKVYKRDAFKEIAGALEGKRIKRIGFEDNILTYSQYRLLRKYFRKKRLYPVSRYMSSLRAIKDEEELRLIKKAINISEEALLEVKKKIKPGAKEIDLAKYFEKIATDKGSHGMAFETIFLSGKNSALVHGSPSSKKIRKGELLLIDFGCVYNGYRSDQTVTYGVGKLPDKAVKFYNTVKEAQGLALDVIKPGVKLSKPAKVVEEYFKSKGYEMVHGLGHGVGLQIHEFPSVSSVSKGVFEEGMVVTVEPGIYIEGFGGVRIEDLVLVTKNGYKLLTTLPKDLEII